MSQQLARYGTGSSKSSAASRCTWKSFFCPSCHSITSHVIPFFPFPTPPIQPLCCGKMSSSFFPGMTSQAQSAQVPRNPSLLQLKGCSALSSMSLPRLKISRNLKNTFRSNTNCIAGLSKAMRVEGEARQQWFYKQHCESSTSSVFEISNFQSNVQPSCIQATSSISSGSSSVGLVGGTNTCHFWHEGQNNPSAQCFANKLDLS